MVSIWDGVHSGWCLFGMVSIRDCVHSGWCPMGLCPCGIASIPDSVQDPQKGMKNGSNNFTYIRIDIRHNYETFFCLLKNV